LLRAVDRQSSLVAKRDYAILLTLLLTGLNEAELRHLRWSQVHVSSQPVRLEVDPGIPAKELPPPAWNAIRAYLQVSGRLAVMQPDDFIFAPLADPLLQPPTDLPEDWCRGRPPSTE
jgi:integrase